MDRRRIAMWSAGVVGIVVAVIVLKQTSEPLEQRTAPTVQPPPTTVAETAAPDVVLPSAAESPQDAGKLELTPGDQLLRVRWADAVPRQADPPDGATGYHLRWGRPGQLDREQLVAAPEAELRGLTNGVEYEVEVRSVDAFGQRSEPVRATAVPDPGPPDPWPDELTGLYDDFETGTAPDPAIWSVQRLGSDCLRAGRGVQHEVGRLVLDLRCGSTAAVLRARTPLRLTDGPVLGRIGLVTDAPISGGQVSIALLPGPGSALATPPSGHLGRPEPGVAIEDQTLPPGGIRAVIDANRISVNVGPDTPAVADPPDPPDRAELATVSAPGITSRWELRLTTDGVQLYRDDRLAAVTHVLPDWTEAVVQVEFTGPPGDTARLHVDAIGFTGPAGTAPNVVEVPDVINGRAVYVGPTDSPGGEYPLPAAKDAESATLHAVIGPGRGCPVPDVVAYFGGGQTVQMAPASPASGGDVQYCAVVGALSPALLEQLRSGELESPYLASDKISGSVTLGGSMLVVGFPPEADIRPKPVVEQPDPPPTGGHRMAQLRAELRNAAGEDLVPGVPVEPGRLVLNVTLDGPAGQRSTGQLAGMAGIQVRLDGKLIAGLPTTMDGAAVAGEYQFGLSAANMSSGQHAMEVRVVSTQPGTQPRSTWVTFHVR